MTRYAPLWLQQATYPAAVDRRLPGVLWPAAAVTGCAVTAAAAMNANVAAGQVAVPTPNTTGTVLCVSDAVEVVTLAAAPGAGLNRVDLVVCQARGNDLDGGANNDFVFAPVTGIAAASPAVPATPPGAVALAQILVPGASASIVAGNITDVRPSPLAVPTPTVYSAVASGAVATGSAEITLATVNVPALRYPSAIVASAFATSHNTVASDEYTHRIRVAGNDQGAAYIRFGGVNSRTLVAVPTSTPYALAANTPVAVTFTAVRTAGTGGLAQDLPGVLTVVAYPNA